MFLMMYLGMALYSRFGRLSNVPYCVRSSQSPRQLMADKLCSSSRSSDRNEKRSLFGIDMDIGDTVTVVYGHRSAVQKMLFM
jgi:hypothetical protein